MGNGRVRQFRKGKGYESIPREFLQQKELSMEAAFLLLNLTSYQEDWNLYKTEVYHRFPKNGRRQIDRMWDEVVECGYMLQYRKRVGKKYVYDYIFSIDKFSEEDKKYVDKIQSEDGFEYYMKDSMRKKMIEKELEKKRQEQELFESEEESSNDTNGEVSGIWDVRNAQSKIWDVQNEQSKIWDVQNEQSNLDSPKRTTRRDTINRDDDDNKYNNAHAHASGKLGNKKTGQPEFDFNNKDLVIVGKLLVRSGVEYDESMEILNELSKDIKLLNAELIIAQLEWCVQKAQSEGIIDFPKYFLNGLRKRVDGSRYLKRSDFAEDLKKGLVGSFLMDKEQQSSKPVPLHNWLEE